MKKLSPEALKSLSEVTDNEINEVLGAGNCGGVVCTLTKDCHLNSLTSKLRCC